MNTTPQNTPFKQTEIGSIPQDWEVKKLGEIVDFQGGSQPPLTTFIYSPKEGYIRLLQIRDYKTDKFETFIPIKFARKFCNENDIMIGRYGPPIFQILKGLEGAYNVALMKAIPSNKTTREYIYHFLKQDSLFNFVEKLSQRSSGQTGVDLQELRAYPLSLPPLPEQTAIATALSDADALIGSLEKLIHKKRLLKQATMQHLLTPKEDWEVKTYGEIFDFLTTATYSRAELTQNDDIKYVHYGDIHTKWDSFLDFTKSDLPTITVEQIKNYPLLKEGDIIMADASEDYNGIGKSVEVKNLEDVKAISGLHTFLLRDKYEIFVNGFKGYIHSNKFVKSQFDRLATGLKVYGVSKNNLKTVQIPIPPKAEQTRIATILSDMDAELSGLKGKLEKYRQLKQGMMQQLLTGKIRLVG